MKTLIELPDTLKVSKINTKRVAILVLFILIAVVMIVQILLIESDKDSTISWIMHYSVVGSIIGAVIVYFSLKHDVSVDNNSPIIYKSIDFKESNYDKIVKLTASNKWNDVGKLLKESNGIAMKIEIAYTLDKNFAAYQFFRFVPHSFEPCSDIIYVKREDIAMFNTILSTYK